MTEIVLFGGSFDPVQNGHVQFIRLLSTRFSQVIVVPCQKSPFKLDAAVASAADRIRMLEIALAGLPNVLVSRFETEASGVSYTYLTLAHYKQIYPDATFYLAIGSDMLDRLDEWKEAAYLKANACWFVSQRDGYSTDSVESLRNAGYNIERCGVAIPDYSSTAVKVDIAFKKLPPVPNDVYDYIMAHALYTRYTAITARYAEFNMKPERIEHTYRAVMTGIRLAKQFNADVEKTVIALLLHDIGKYSDAVSLEKYGIRIGENVADMPAPVRHAPIGAMIAEQCFGIDDAEILDAIAVHTTGRAHMTKLAQIVYLADCIEPGREFAGVEEIRRIAFINLDRGMEAALKNVLEYVAQSSDVSPETAEAYTYYVRHNKGEV